MPTEKLFQWRFTQVGSVKSYEHCTVAQQGSRVIGMIHSYPIDDLTNAPSDPRLTADRLAFVAPIAAHVLIRHTGDLLLMMRRL